MRTEPADGERHARVKHSRNSRVVAAAVGIGVAAPAAAQQLPSFELLRYEEDYGVLRDANGARGPLDAVKFLPLTAHGEAYLSLGGEARLRYERFDNPAFGQDPQAAHGVFLQRYSLHGDLHLRRRVRVFGQLSSALEDGRDGGPSPVDENRLDVQNAFVDVSFALADAAKLTVRGGRQELSYGSARIVGVRDGPNVRRSFDGVRAILDIPGWRIDALYARPRRDERGVFDDGSNDDRALWGVYAVGEPGLLPAGAIDLYYLGFAAEDTAFDQGPADETRHSLGLRVWGADGRWDWNWEAVYQFGRFGDGDIGAWTVATDTGYTWQSVAWTPRVAINANIASGDGDPADADLGTFNALFPRGSYFSQAAILGPRNFFNLHPFVTIHPAPDWSVTTDVNVFWRLDTGDGVYAPNGGLIRSGAGSDTRFVGSAVSLTSVWQISRRFAVTGIYTHFFPGEFIEDTGPSKEIDFFELTARFRW